MKKELEYKDLEMINGATVGELADLANAFSSGNKILTNSAHTPLVNAATAYEVRRKLKQLGIQANISTGIAGTGYFSDPNEYTNIATGERMTHWEVVSIIQARG